MNVSAEIITSSAQDVLTVPQSAVQRGGIMFVKNSDVKADAKKPDEKMLERMEVPKGYTAVLVETGITDGTRVEIKSGISENDVIAYYSIATKNGTGQTGTSSSGMMGGGFHSGMMGGGMPGGMMGGGMRSSGGMTGGMRSGGGSR